jgi:hypothetical protein
VLAKTGNPEYGRSASPAEVLIGEQQLRSHMLNVSFLGPTLLWVNCQGRASFYFFFSFFILKAVFVLVFSFGFFGNLARLLWQCSGFNDLA